MELPEALPAESLEPPLLSPVLLPAALEPAGVADGDGVELEDTDSELCAGADVELEPGDGDAVGAEDSLEADIDLGTGLLPLGLATGAEMLFGPGTAAGAVLGRGAEVTGKEEAKIVLGDAEGREVAEGGSPEIIVVSFILPKLDTPEFSMAKALVLID